MGNYPDNLPESTPPPNPRGAAAPVAPSAPPPPLAQSTMDSLANRGRDVASQADQMTNGRMPAQTMFNPDNRLPDTEGVFHRAVRGFKSLTGI